MAASSALSMSRHPGSRPSSTLDRAQSIYFTTLPNIDIRYREPHQTAKERGTYRIAGDRVCNTAAHTNAAFRVQCAACLLFFSSCLNNSNFHINVSHGYFMVLRPYRTYLRCTAPRREPPVRCSGFGPRVVARNPEIPPISPVGFMGFEGRMATL